MKRLFTIVIAIILCLFTSTLFSQNFNKVDFAPKVENGRVLTANEVLLNKKLTSVLGQIWVPSSWVDETRQTYEYTNAGLMKKVVFQKIENSEWKTNMEVLYEYNVENQMVVNIMWFYEDDGSILMGSKWENTYLGDKMDEGISSDWDIDNAKWETDSKWQYEYNGELVSKISDYQFVLAWVLSQQYTYTYDTQGKEIEELTEIWNETDNAFENSYITTTTYHQNGKISEELSKRWDVDNQQWSEDNNSLFEYQYDANGNRIEYVSTMDFGFFVVKTKLQSEYDANNFLIEDLDFTWDDNTSTWIESSKSEYTNDDEGNALIELIYNKFSGNWDYSEKITRNYAGAVDVESDELNIPETFTLSQNYPNPFNPTTRINYAITKQTNVSLIVYDALGRAVSNLLNRVQPQGNYEVEFNASNLTSGIYFYRIQAGSFVQTKKMILMK